MSVDDVLHEVEKDRVFYEQSGGGVTLSGGEALKQHHFAWALLCECKRQGIRTALETCGFTEKDVLIKMAGVTDLPRFALTYDTEHRQNDNAYGCHEMLQVLHTETIA